MRVKNVGAKKKPCLRTGFVGLYYCVVAKGYILCVEWRCVFVYRSVSLSSIVARGRSSGVHTCCWWCLCASDAWRFLRRSFDRPTGGRAVPCLRNDPSPAIAMAGVCLLRLSGLSSQFLFARPHTRIAFVRSFCSMFESAPNTNCGTETKPNQTNKNGVRRGVGLRRGACVQSAKKSQTRRRVQQTGRGDTDTRKRARRKREKKKPFVSE